MRARERGVLRQVARRRQPERSVRCGRNYHRSNCDPLAAGCIRPERITRPRDSGASVPGEVREEQSSRGNLASPRGRYRAPPSCRCRRGSSRNCWLHSVYLARRLALSRAPCASGFTGRVSKPRSGIPDPFPPPCILITLDINSIPIH